MRVATNSHHDDLSILQSVIQDEWKQHDPSPSDSEWIYLRKDRIKRKRGVFKCLPVYFSNDLVHGSWWFTIGSAFTVVIALIPLAGPYFQWNELKKNELPILQDPVTFNVTIISGIIYTLGSLAFVRAAEEPPLKPLFQCSHHISTDELLAAWLFFLGSLPEPLLLVYYIYQYPTVLFYWGSLVASICFMAATFAFVLTCYPSAFPDKSLPTKSYVRQYVVKFCCPENVQLLYHLSNDWLAATWLFFFCSLLLTIGSAGMLIDSLFKRRRIDAILWLLS